MRVNFDRGTCTVQREQGDQRAATESHFWFLLRNQLNGQKSAPMRSINERWRRVRPCKTDGCLTGMPFALAVGRDWRKVISDDHYAIRSPHQYYNEKREVVLAYDGGQSDE